VPADRLHHFPVTPLLLLHMDRDESVRRRDQEKDMKNQPEKQAKDDQDQVEERRKRLPVEEQTDRR
jgi:hypothetical protein